jgi:phage gp29-like protein
VHNDVRLDKRNSDLRMITPTIQELIDALCLLNNFEKHTIILGGEQDLKVAVVDRDIKLKSLGVEFNDQYVIETYGIKAEHFKMNTSDAVPNTKFSALPHQAFSFKASVQKQSPEQQEVDSLAVRPMQLLSDDQIVQIAASSESIEDMQNKLFSLFTNAESSQFNEALDRALFTADVMGFVDSKEGK